MTQAVLWAGGWAHPGHDLIAAVEELAATRRIDLHTITDPDLAPGSVKSGCDLLIVGACWFSMRDDRYSHEQRNDYAVAFSPELGATLSGLRASGCSLLALHTAPICFDGADVWSDWLGGNWNWETSWHPPPEPIEVLPTGSALGFEPFTVVDELYQGLDVDPAVTVVAQSAAGDPLVWLHQAAASRTAVNLLGHDRRSLQAPAHMQLNSQLLDWLLPS